MKDINKFCNCDNNEILFVRFINLTKLEYGGSIYKKQFDCLSIIENIKKNYENEFSYTIKTHKWNIDNDIIILIDNVCDKIYIFNKPDKYLLYYNEENYLIINQENQENNIISKKFSIVNNNSNKEIDEEISYFSFENFRSKTCCIL